MQCVIELPLKRPFELRMIEIAGMQIEVIGVHWNRRILELNDDLYGFSLAVSRKVEQRVLVQSQLAEDFISFLVKRCLEKRRADLQTIGRDLPQLEKIEPPFPRVSYDDAVQMLQEGHGKGALENKFEWGGDLGSPDETYISSQFDKPVMVHRYPAKVKAFYMEPDPQRPELALCVDVLAPEGYGEIVGGSQRMASHDLLLERIRAHGLPEEAFKWYLDLRKFGSVPHGGFGMGIERAVAWICGLEHVRETIPFPRMLYRLYP